MPATMFPKTIDVKYYKENGSREDLVFNALEKYLSPEYHVYHEVVFNYWGRRDIQNERQDCLHEHEGDFIIFHKDKGILILEAKNGKIVRKVDEKTGKIYLAQDFNGAKNPYEQARKLKWDLNNIFEREGLNSYNCRLRHAVWFISLKKSDLNSMDLGSSGCVQITLCNDDLYNPSLQDRIDELFDIKAEKNVTTNLTQADFEKIERKIFNPPLIAHYNSSMFDNIAEHDMNNLLEEQYKILYFLEDQKTATISGVAGTGKTYIACQKARIHSKKGEKVLFLCYNYRLINSLKEKFKDDPEMENVDFYTLNKLLSDWCGAGANYYDLQIEIDKKAYEGFPYNHIIIDEAQDFGRRIEDNNDTYGEFDNTITTCVDKFKDAVFFDETTPGSFYLFYDKYQLVQGEDVPNYIKNADCKVTLYINCRNTENIAQTATKPLGELKNKKVLRNNISGDKPVFYISNDKDKKIKSLDSILTECINNNIKEDKIQILTYKTIGKDCFLHDKLKKINDAEKNDIYKYVYKNKLFDVTTVRKFKGCETSVLILIDVDRNSFIYENSQLLFYTGASRAKNKLYVIADLKNEDYPFINTALNFEKEKGKKQEAIFKNNMNIKIKKMITI